MNSSTRILLLAAMLVASGLPGRAGAALVVDFGGDMVSGDTVFYPGISAASPLWVVENTVDGGTDFNGDGDQLDRVAWRQFDLVTPWSPASGYSGPAFFGGFTLHQESTKSSFPGRTDNFIIQNNGVSDEIRPVNRDASMQLALVFATTTLGRAEAGDSIALTVGQDTSTSGHFLIVNDDVLYVSSTSLISGTNATTTIDPSAIMWAEYSVANGSKNHFQDGSFNFNVPGTSLTSISHIGYYTFAGDTNATLELKALQATITVPEPGSLAIMACGLAGFCLIARRRRLASRASAPQSAL